MAIKDRFTGNLGRLTVLTTSGSTSGEGGRDGVGSAGVSGCPAVGFTAAHEGTAHCPLGKFEVGVEVVTTLKYTKVLPIRDL
uniref:Uncharacterized protein B1642C07.53 n=1 Tax=Oryza sativa subsp. japonica TaxID=39947 RepID=Q5F1X3_ORYSJ|nr:hypothetical protein [Oryza sativa Japonica Group]